jgi:hypothetical protein
MKRKLLIAVPLLCAVAVAAWIYRPKHDAGGEGYIGERSVTLWSGVAQVREPLDALHYGDHVEIVARHNDSVKVRTIAGEIGWIDARSLMEPALWRCGSAARNSWATRRSYRCRLAVGPRWPPICECCQAARNRACINSAEGTQWKL